MFTSDKIRARKTFFLYIGMTLFFAVFGFVYERFSHGVYSKCMVFAFVIPLLLGVVPYAFRVLLETAVPVRIASQLYGCGVLSLTLGSVFRGVLEIYGTTNTKIILYPVLSGLFFLASFVICHMRRSVAK